MPNRPSRHRKDAKIIRSLGKLHTDQRGGVAVMMGLLFPVLLGVLGLGFEISNWYLKTRSMQNAADAAVIAAASNGEDNYNLEAAAVAAHYGFIDGTDSVTVTSNNNAPCPAGATNSPCYSVTISSKVPLFLSQFVGYTGDTTLNGALEKQLVGAAVAVPSIIQQPVCLLTLSQTAQGIRTNGAPNSNFTGCSVMSDSTSNCNGSNLQATYGFAHGSNDGCGIKQKSEVPIVPDPYLTMAVNIPANTCGSGANAYPQEPTKKNDPQLPSSNRWSSAKSFSGAVQMCGDVQLTADVVITTPDNLTGATLVIENGQLDLNGHTLSTANGSALTIVFSGTAGNYTHALTDNATGQGGVLNIQAPSSPSALFPGVAIYQDPSLKSGVDITYKGNNPAWDVTGAVYLPNANVTMSGDVNKSSNGADCFVMVANTVLINGTSNIYAQSPNGAGCKQAGLNMPSAQIPGRSQLVY